jgi:hypothetical protein
MKTSAAFPMRLFLMADKSLPLACDKQRTRPHGGRKIEVFVNRIEQLFNSMDPSPFHEKDLDSEAEEFIVNRLQEFSPHDRVSLIVHVNQNPEQVDLQHDVEMAVHNHFLYRAKLKRLEFHRLLEHGRTSLVIGLVFLALCLLASELLLLRQQSGTFVSLLRESLTIAGWVAMWRPMQIFLYDWWPLRHVGQIYKKISRMRVEVRTGDATG